MSGVALTLAKKRARAAGFVTNANANKDLTRITRQSGVNAKVKGSFSVILVFQLRQSPWALRNLDQIPPRSEECNGKDLG
ncbi:uncharacterized [Tachysurus ichikawai]